MNGKSNILTVLFPNLQVQEEAYGASGVPRDLPPDGEGSSVDVSSDTDIITKCTPVPPERAVIGIVKKGNIGGGGSVKDGEPTEQAGKAKKMAVCKNPQMKDKGLMTSADVAATGPHKTPTAFDEAKQEVEEQVYYIRPRDSPSPYDFRTLKPSLPLISEQADDEGFLGPKLQDLTIASYLYSPLREDGGFSKTNITNVLLPPQEGKDARTTSADVAVPGPHKTRTLFDEPKQEEVEQHVSHTRPRDVPSRYNFRALKPSLPLSSGPADNEGFVGPKLQDLTIASCLYSPLHEDTSFSKDEDGCCSLVSCNIMNIVKDQDLSKFPSTTDSTTSQPLPTRLVCDDKSNNDKFAPVDVTRSGLGHVLCTSQATDQVKVFRSDGSEGLLKLGDKKTFQSLRNILYIPPLAADQSGDEPALKAGCIVVLDNAGFHIFAENCLFVSTLLDGMGYKYRGLSYIRREENLSIVTIDVDGETDVHLVLIDLITEQPERILIAEMDDSRLKCRFVVVAAAASRDGMANHAYVSAMFSKDLFRINLETGECIKMELVENKSRFRLGSPTGLAVDKRGNILVADREKNTIESFAANGLHVKSLGSVDGGGAAATQLSQPIGIHYSPKEDRLYVASNNNKMVLVYDLAGG